MLSVLTGRLYIAIKGQACYKNLGCCPGTLEAGVYFKGPWEGTDTSLSCSLKYRNQVCHFEM